MKFDLLQYMSQRMNLLEEPRGYAPVITISRQYGCSAKELAHLLVERIRQKYPNQPQWRWVNKEIFEGVARELQVSTDRILHVFEGQKKDFVWELFRGFADERHLSDAAIRNKLITLLAGIAYEGNRIIIGLGGAAVLQNHPKALHLRLMASTKWRLAYLSEHSDASVLELKAEMSQMDEKRERLLNSYSGLKHGEELFDLTLNVAKVDQEEQVEMVLRLMEMRGFFATK